MFGDASAANSAAEDGRVTASELKYLQGNNSDDYISDVVDSEKDKLVDRMGEQLLLLADNSEKEARLIRQSLRLNPIIPPAAAPSSVSSFDVEGQKRRGDATTTAATVTTGQVSDRVHQSARALRSTLLTSSQRGSRAALLEMMQEDEAEEDLKKQRKLLKPSTAQILRILSISLLILIVLYLLLLEGTVLAGPPRLPIGPYKIVEAQVGQHFFDYYDFYSGKDSIGSNGYLYYVSRDVATKNNIVNVITETVDSGSMVEIYDDDGAQEVDWLLEDLKFLDELKRRQADEKKAVDESAKEAVESGGNTTTADKSLNVTKNEESDNNATTAVTKNNTASNASITKKNTTTRRHLTKTQSHLEAFNPDPVINGTTTNNNATTTAGNNGNNVTETFVYISSNATEAGPRNSVRLEGRRRFNRGLFIIDLRHMPAGCGTWPAFWLTDEANWPVNGEIDIVEGVNYQDTAKTALHTTKECRMDDVPEGSKTGTWDTAVGIPDKKTGIPDMTFRYAENCFVYDPHQWINQGCVAADLKLEGRSLGVPLNKNGGGVYALEWDPTNTHIRTWVFTPHGRVPRNLRDAMRTAMNEDESTRVAPDTNKWGLPYGHFPIGDGTNCPAEHFRNMRLVINLAFCGSVAGTRYFMDCPKQFKQYKTCEQWVASDPDELKEAYWKIRGVYVYERDWEKQW
eukprot:scaffold5730_cov55-Cyclotella_meneghiniana.AAC.9